MFRGANPGAVQYRQEKIDFALFDMTRDPFEEVNVIDRYPEAAARMKQFAEEHRQQFYSGAQPT